MEAFFANEALEARREKKTDGNGKTVDNKANQVDGAETAPQATATPGQHVSKENTELESTRATAKVPADVDITSPAPAPEPKNSEATSHDPKEEDVAMHDDIGELQTANQVSESERTGDEATADASPSGAVPSRVLTSSGLLPSLRGDTSREQTSTDTTVDTAMVDAPSNKVAREREDDIEDGRLVKRARTEDAESANNSTSQNHVGATAAPTNEMSTDLPAVTIPPRVRASEKDGSLSDPKLDSYAITPYANREIRRVLASIKKTKVGNNFKDPVYKKWPFLWDSYVQRVAKPMDIGQIERNLRENVYTKHGDFINDLFLIFENSVAFNGLGNIVTDEAKSLVDNFFSRLSEISSREPQKSDKKDSKQLPTRQTGPRAAAGRRESRGAATSPIEESVTAFAASPIAVSIPATGVSSNPVPVGGNAEANTPVFAVPASGMPIIRRDSTKADGDRPKRPIHPPKNRDLGYEPKNPKKKLPEFRFCEEVLKELMKQRHYETNHWFLRPVDAVAMQIPTYHKVIKKPMDLGTMQTKLNLGEYNSAKDFENDVQLIIRNCRKFNVTGEVVNAAGRLEELFKVKWAEKETWISAHTSHGSASVLSPVGGPKEDDSDEDVEGSEAEGDEISGAPATSDTVDALVKRLEEENDRLRSLLMAKIPDMTMITTQQTVLNMIQKQVVEEKTKLAAAETDRRSRKPAKAKLAKGKKAPTSGGISAKRTTAGGMGGATSKKVSGTSAKKAPKAKAFGQAEKNVVTDGINNLDVQQLERAIDIIKKDTSQEVSRWFIFSTLARLYLGIT